MSLVRSYGPFVDARKPISKSITTYNLCRMNMLLHGLHYPKDDGVMAINDRKPRLDRRAVCSAPPPA
ncbi:MAG TPA: hypothetical protein VF278_18265 [Pirellulales bacterium]